MSEGQRPRIALLGSNMVDLVTYVDRMPVKGETVEARSFEMGHRGKGANQAAAAAKLGASVARCNDVPELLSLLHSVRNCVVGEKALVVAAGCDRQAREPQRHC